MVSLTQYPNLDNPYGCGQKQIGLFKDAAMPNHEVYCVVLPFGMATFDTPDGPRKMAVPMGYATGTGNLLLKTDFEAGHAPIPTFPRAKAQRIADAWKKKGYQAHARIYEPARETVLV